MYLALCSAGKLIDSLAFQPGAAVLHDGVRALRERQLLGSCGAAGQQRLQPLLLLQPLRLLLRQSSAPQADFTLQIADGGFQRAYIRRGQLEGQMAGANKACNSPVRAFPS